MKQREQEQQMNNLPEDYEKASWMRTTPLRSESFLNLDDDKDQQQIEHDEHNA